MAGALCNFLTLPAKESRWGNNDAASCLAFKPLRDCALRPPSGLSLGKSCEKYMREQQTNLSGHNRTFVHDDKSASLFYLWLGTNKDYSGFPEATNYSLQICRSVATVKTVPVAVKVVSAWMSVSHLLVSQVWPLKNSSWGTSDTILLTFGGSQGDERRRVHSKVAEKPSRHSDVMSCLTRCWAGGPQSGSIVPYHAGRGAKVKKKSS